MSPDEFAEYEASIGHVRNFKKGEVESYLKNDLNFEQMLVYYAGFPIYSPIYRDLTNRKPIANTVMACERSTIQALYSAFFYFLLRFASTKKRWGDQFIGLFIKRAT